MPCAQNPFGPSTMECTQSQRVSLYRNHHVVLQTELVRALGSSWGTGMKCYQCRCVKMCT